MAFPEQRKAYMLRYIMRLSWEKIAEQVVNLREEHPSWVRVKETATQGDRDRGAQTQRHTQTQKRTQRYADTGARTCARRHRCWSMATATAKTATCKA